MNLKKIMLSKRNEMGKATIVQFHLYWNSRNGKTMVTKTDKCLPGEEN